MLRRCFFISGLLLVTCISKTPLQALPFSFTPPKKWQCIDDKEALPGKVDVVYIGNAKNGFAPSLNVAREATEATLAEYTATARKYHESQPATKCASLGCIECKVGQANLLQIDKQSEFGNVRFLQAALVHEGVAYVLTATCLEEEYENYYPQFLQAIQTFHLVESR